MADKKPAPPESSAITPFQVLGIVFGIMVLITIAGNIVDNNRFIRYFAKEDISPSLGSKVVNIEDIKVRNGAGGNFVGVQKKGTTGKIVEGPIENFNKTWWRVDYEEAPDGWVSEKEVSTKIPKYIIGNIIPIIFNFLRPIFIVLSIIAGLIFIIIRLKIAAFEREQNKKSQVAGEQKILATKDAPALKNEDPLPVPGLPIGEAPKTEDVHNKRWSKIQSLIRSYNSNDWKQAIIEADIILDEMLKKMGYKGNSIGDRLKTVEPSDFTTLDSAWEAHKFRNRIAHGSDYNISKDEAEEVIKRYEEVFKEFFYI